MEVLFGFLIISGIFYFIPTFIAFDKNHPNKEAIFACNFIFGWTFIGWGIALVWSCTAS